MSNLGVGKCPAPGSANFANAPPPGLTGRANARGGEDAAGIDYTLTDARSPC